MVRKGKAGGTADIVGGKTGKVGEGAKDKSGKDTGEEKKVEKLNSLDIILLKLEAAEVKREAELKIVTDGQARLERELGKLSKLHTERDVRLTAELEIMNTGGR